MKTASVAFGFLLLSTTAVAQQYVISTIAGGARPVNIPGMSASLSASAPLYIAADRAGNVFFVDQNRVLRLDAAGVLTLVAGNGTTGFSGDNGPATSAQLSDPNAIAVDPAGNLYIADGGYRIRKVSNGVITTVAGNGTLGFSGDNGPATSAQLGWYNNSIAADAAGNLYIGETDVPGCRIREVSNGMITTVAGNGTGGFSGDNGPATSAQLSGAQAIAVDPAGNLYIADGARIRMVSNGVITTVAGNGTRGFSGDNGPATSAQFGYPNSLAVDSAGNLYIADTNGLRIRKVSNGVITSVAGGGSSLDDNVPAASALLNGTIGVAVDFAGILYIGDPSSNRIRKVSNGVITTMAGNGFQGFSGDNGPATSAQLNADRGITVDSAGNLYIADTFNHRIRKVSNGVITTVAGNGMAGFNGGNFGTAGFSGDNGPATSAQLSFPMGVAVDAAGSLYIADYGNSRIRKVSNGVITTVAGNGTHGFSGDNGPATSAQLNGAFGGVAVDSAGNLYIADGANYRIRKVSNGVITTVAGNGTQGFGGDNGPATSAQLSGPKGVTVDSAGNLYIADSDNGRIRKVSNGTITTVAGGSSSGVYGDTGPATSVPLENPSGVAVDSAGNFYIAASSLLLKVSNGLISTVAGNGLFGFSGDNGPATSGQLVANDVAIDSVGNLYIAAGNRVRLLTPTGSSCFYSVAPTSLQAPASGGSLTVGMQTTPSCSWTVSGLPSWITVSGASSGAGTATITLAVAANAGGSRSAIISIGNVSVSISQAGLTGASASITAVTNGASNLTGPIAPGEIIVLYGSGLGPAQITEAHVGSDGRFGTQLAGTTVSFNGIPAPMIYASAAQVAAVVPYVAVWPAERVEQPARNPRQKDAFKQ